MEKGRSNFRSLEQMIKIYKLIAKSYEHSLESAAKYGTDIDIEEDEWHTSIQEYKQLAEWLEELKIVHDVIDDLEDYDEIMVGYLRKKMKGEL